MSTRKRFGGFFRATRKALGLTLREFCRRNGFDPGNVSRLERGAAPPPQTQEGLESYATALKLRRGTDAWERYFELAAAETGRIPPELLESHGKVEQLPRLFRQLRGGRHKNYVTARHFEAWAEVLSARATLPQLLRRLVSTLPEKDVVRINFPSGEQVQRPDWDGIVEATSGDAFVPAGTSGWEMGVDKDPRAKAEDDFTKRTKNSLDLDKSRTSFVFVTPRKWQEKARWCQAKTKLGVWKDVRVYDSANLEEWLERAPAVDAWFAHILGLRPEGLIDIDEYWANLEAVTDPSLKPEVFLASRAKEVAKLEEWLKGPAGAMVIEANSPSEAVDFVAAFSRQVAEGDRFVARTLIVESREAWRTIAASDRELLLIAHPALSVEPEMVAEAVRQGHRVLLCSNQMPSERFSRLQLPRAYRYDLKQGLVSSGLDDVEAVKYAYNSGGSLTVLKRLLGRFPGTTQPEWSRPSNASALVPFLLVGSWDAASEGDRLVLERLSNQLYRDVSSAAAQWLQTPDAPITRAFSRWSLVSRDDSWFLLAPCVTSDHLRRFEEVALEVLAEDDPAYELPPDQRWQASLHRKALGHSPSLRTGLAETLALLGGRPDRLPNAQGLQGRVNRIVRALLDGADWKRWVSLSAQLPLFAEAAPETFLEVVDRDLNGPEPELVKVFEQEGASPFSSSPHTGLLRALEGLAWERSYLPTVSLILARLAELDRGGKLANPPMNSLQEIYVPWFPQTTAPVEERVRILEVVARRRRDAGWHLLVNLLPNQQRIAHPIHRPSWRDWTLTWSEGATTAEYHYQVAACAHLLVEHLGQDLGRWKELIGQFESLPEPTQKEFLGRLLEFDIGSLDADARRAITEAVREKVSWHRRFSDANWSLPKEIVAELERVQSRFEPDDRVTRNAWLFAPYWRVEEQTEGQEVDVAGQRQRAVRDILAGEGWEGMVALAEAAEAPEEVGFALGADGSKESEPEVLPHLLVSKDEKLARFARGYVWGRYQKEGWDWIEGLQTSGWSAEEVGRVALVLPFEGRTWEFVSGKGSGVEQYYWHHAGGFCRSGGSEEVVFAVSALLKYQRPFRAFGVLGMALHQKCVLEPSLLMDVLQAGLDVPIAENERDALRHARYNAHELFEELQKGVKGQDPRIDADRLAGLEWGYLGLLDGRPVRAETLLSMLKNDPEFFVGLLGLIFRPRTESGGASKEASEEEKARAENAYRLLMSWDEVPGSQEDGTVEEEALLNWVRKARTLAKEQDRLEVCDEQIGEVFAHDRERPGEPWPSIPVRDAIEEIGTDEVVDGFRVGIFNKRGVYSKSPAEGGEQERELARKYQEFAEASKIEWPKTAAALRAVAQGYEADALREDAEAMLE